jgi:hypothetical protein
MKKLIFLIFTVVMVTTGTLSAETIDGRVVDNYNHGIAGVTVQVHTSLMSFYTLTDHDGLFHLDYAGNNPVATFTAIGYTVSDISWSSSLVEYVTVTMVPVPYLANAYTRERSPFLTRKEDSEILVA